MNKEEMAITISMINKVTQDSESPKAQMPILAVMPYSPTNHRPQTHLYIFHPFLAHQ